MFAVLLLVLVFVSTASASLLPHREIPACERAAPQLDEFAIAACLGDTEPCFGRCASTEMLMRPRMARGVVDADLHGKSEPPNGRDRLIQAQPNAPNEAIVEYQYDADDRRIARIETPRINGVPQAPITTLYVFDNSTLLHEANLAGITDTYRRSAKLDRHIAHQTNTVRHYQLDALDTPVAMTDATGATVNATTFDAWGNPTQQTAAGTTTVPWQVPNYNPLISGQAALLNNDNQSIGFTGYQKDSATGLYYAGARFYDPLIGGFNGMDPWSGDSSRPMTLNKYLYGLANPTRFLDPDGRRPCDGMQCLLVQARETANTPEDKARITAMMVTNQRQQANTVDLAAGVGAQLGEDVAEGVYGLASAFSDAVVAPFEYVVGGPGFGSGDRTVARVRGVGEAIGNFAGKVGQEGLYDSTITSAGRALTRSLESSAERASQDDYFGAGRALSGPASALTGVVAVERALAKFAVGAGKGGAAAQTRVAVEAPNAVAIDSAAIPGQPVVFAGHGEIRYPWAQFTLTGDQYLAAPRPGHLLQEPAGQALESGGMPALRDAVARDSSLKVDLDAMVEYGPGDRVYNATLLPPNHPGMDRFVPLPGSRVVTTPTLMSELIGTQPGCYIWAACTKVVD